MNVCMHMNFFLCYPTGHSVRMKVRIPVAPDSKIKAEKSVILSPHDMVRIHYQA